MKKRKSGFAFAIVWVLYLIASITFVILGSRSVFNKGQKKILEQIAETKYLQFEAGLVSQLPLALQMAQVPATVNYIEHPTVPQYRDIGLAEFASFRNGFLSKSVYYMSENDMIFCSENDAGKTAYLVDPKLPENYWWDYTVNNPKAYNFNINYNEELKAVCVWVNAKVVNAQGRGIGMVGTGIPLDGFTKTMYEDLDPRIEMYLFNKNMEITGAKDVSLIPKKESLYKLMPELKGKKIEDGKVNYIKANCGVFLIYEIPSVDWKIVVHKEYSLADFFSGAATPLVIAFFIALFLIGFQFVYQLVKPLKVLRLSITDISSGNADLRKRIDMEGINTIKSLEQICSGFNGFIEKLGEIVSALKVSKDQLVTAGEFLSNSTEDTTNCISQMIDNIGSMSSQIGTQTNSVSQTASAVNQIASNIESLNRMIESQASVVTQASASVEQMIGNINSVSNSVQKMSKSFLVLEEQVATGVHKQNDVNMMIDEIEKESQALAEANTVISSIAEQTNLLAMNAAIEAAHAGEAGKGFSVVADEIRKLSEDSGAQSQAIGNQLNKIISAIQNIVDASQIATDAFNDVSNGINSTADLVREITNAMDEQNEGSKQIVDALNSMNDTSNEVKSSSFEMAEGNKAILSEIRSLQESTNQIKDEMDKMSNGARRIQETGTALSDLSGQLDDSIKAIETQVDQFQI